MRPGVFVCALIAVCLSALAAASKLPPGHRPARVAPSDASLQSGDSAARSSASPIVIAQGIPVRALGIGSTPGSAGADRTLYLTRADLPNQLFSVDLSAPSVASAATPQVKLTRVAGGAQPGSLGDGGPATAAELDLQTDSLSVRSEVTIASDGTLFVADTLNSTVRRIGGPGGPDAGVIRSVAGRWGPRINAQLSAPAAITTDRAGNLYIADAATGALDVLKNAEDEASAPLHKIANLAGAASLAATADGSLLYAASPETGLVIRIDTQSGRVRPVLQTSAGESACANSAAQNDAQPVCPGGLAVDGQNNLFISDVTDGRVLRFDALTGAQTQAASDLSEPGDIAFDAGGNLFVAEQGRNRIVELRGLGAPASNVLLSPASATFPNVALGASSPAISLTVTNSSSTGLTGLTVSVGGADPADFPIVSQSCGAVLSAQSTCAVTMDFTPQAAGARSATLSVADSNPTDSAAVALTGGASSITLSPVSASFPNQPTGGSTASQQFILTNNSTTSAATGVAVATGGGNPADFKIQSSTCTSTLPPSSTCAINVSFAPGTTGARTATLVGTDSNAQDSAMSALSGTGDDYQLQLASGQAQQVSVAAGATATFNLQVVPDANFSGTVAIACPAVSAPGSTSTTDLPAYTTCTANPASVAVSAGSPTPFTVAIATSSGAAAQPGSPGAFGKYPGERLQLLVAFACLLCLLLATWSMVRLSRSNTPDGLASRQLPFRIVGASVLLMLVLAGCGHHSTPPPSTATPIGTYTLTFQSTAQDAQGRSFGVVRAITVTLVVN